MASLFIEGGYLFRSWYEKQKVCWQSLQSNLNTNSESDLYIPTINLTKSSLI